MVGPGDEIAVAYGQGRGHFRASRADREQVIELLKVAFVQDRLTKDELDVRVGQALAARTGADLAALTADIPAEPAAVWLERPPARAASRPTRPLVPARRRPLARVAAGSSCLALAAVAVGASFILDPGGPGIDRPWAGLMLLVAQYAAIVGVCMLWSGLVTSVQQRRSGRRLRPRPGPGGAALDGMRPVPDATRYPV